MFDKIIQSKCDNCIIGKNEKAGKVKLLDRNIGEIRRGSVDAKVLVVLSRYETDKYIDAFELKLKKFGILDYVVVSGLDCSIKDIKGYTQYELYKYCGAVELDRFPNVKAILTCGSGLYAITKTSDITGWFEFKEYLFNQTYFYTPFSYERKIRVYPLPFLDEFVYINGFERFFAEKQIGFVKEYLK